MPSEAFLNKIETDLFCDESQLPVIFNQNEVDVVKRYRWAFTKKLDEPNILDSKLRKQLMKKFAISEGQAYRDIPVIRALVGNIKQATKEFQRYAANHMIQTGYNLIKNAKTGLEVKQGEGMIRGAMAMVKVNMLDKEDILPYAWDEIETDSYTITDNVEILPGMKKLTETEEELEALKMKVRKRFGGNIDQIPEAELVDESKD